MRTSAPRPLALAAATALLLAACGADEPSATIPVPPADDPVADGGLRAPIPVRVSAEATAANRSALGASSMAGDAAVEGELSIMPWFGGWEFEVDPSMPALPDRAIGYEFAEGAPLDAEVVARIAAAVGVGGDVERGAAGDGVRWSVGPDDGSAPSLVVIDDGPLSWYRSDAWALDIGRWDCVIAVEPDGGIGDGAVVGEGKLDEPVSDEGQLDEPVADDLGPDGVIVDDTWIDCPEPEPPVGVPTAEVAEAEAARILGELGLDPANFEFETWADEWFASVTAWPRQDGLRWPLAFGFGFGAEGALQWANGYAATPVATGPYPLVGLDEAVERLDQPLWWGAAGSRAMPEMAGDTAISDVMTDASDVMTDDLPEPVEPDEMPRELVVLVDVRADLWWAWSPDGTVWLLPAYTFVDTEGRWHTVPAVTDEFLVIEEPIVLMDPPIGIDEPILDPTVDVDPAELGELIGLTVEKAEAYLGDHGLSMRVLREDGVDLPATMDLVPTRVNVAVVDGVVTEVLSTG